MTWGLDHEILQANYQIKLQKHSQGLISITSTGPTNDQFKHSYKLTLEIWINTGLSRTDPTTIHR